MISRIAN